MFRIKNRFIHVLMGISLFCLYGLMVVFYDGFKGDSSQESSSHSLLTSPATASILPSILISVKTSEKFHKDRLDIILKTWYTLAPNQTYFFTDTNDPLIEKKTNGHLINTNCSSSHNRKALCCKMSVELDFFVQRNQFKWFCHFDDDNYVNIPRLVDLLSSYDSRDDWYLGKPSIRAPLQIMDRKSGQNIGFWFATGGAGFCLSRSLALKMVPSAGGGKFMSIGDRIRLPDDVTVGYIVEYLLRKPLTVIEQFHSHLEPMKFIKKESLPEQISLSYSQTGGEMNVVSIDDGVDVGRDPTRYVEFSSPPPDPSLSTSVKVYVTAFFLFLPLFTE